MKSSLNSIILLLNYQIKYLPFVYKIRLQNSMIFKPIFLLDQWIWFCRKLKFIFCCNKIFWPGSLDRSFLKVAFVTISSIRYSWKSCKYEWYYINYFIVSKYTLKIQVQQINGMYWSKVVVPFWTNAHLLCRYMHDRNIF